MEQLTKRELEILPFICFSKKEIAQHFKISICTVNMHLNNLLNKFSVDNRSKLLVEVLRKDVIKLENIVVRSE